MLRTLILVSPQLVGRGSSMYLFLVFETDKLSFDFASFRRSFLFDRAYLRLFDNHLISVSGMYSSGLLRASILFYSIPVWTVACGMCRSVCYRCVSVAWGIAVGSLWNVSVCFLCVCVDCLGGCEGRVGYRIVQNSSEKQRNIREEKIYSECKQ